MVGTLLLGKVMYGGHFIQNEVSKSMSVAKSQNFWD